MIISPNLLINQCATLSGTSPGQLEAWKMRTRLELLEDGDLWRWWSIQKLQRFFTVVQKNLDFYVSILIMEILEKVGGKESEKVMVTLGFTSPEMDSFKVVEGVIPSHICRNHFNQAQTRKKSCASQLYDVDFIALTFGFCLGPVEVSIFEVTRLYWNATSDGNTQNIEFRLRSLTARPWKMMVGRRSFPFGSW